MLRYKQSFNAANKPSVRISFCDLILKSQGNIEMVANERDEKKIHSNTLQSCQLVLICDSNSLHRQLIVFRAL